MTESCPESKAKQGKGEEQVNRQVEVADGRAVNKSAGDHHPACDGLRDEEYAHDEVNAEFLERDFLCEEEIENRDGVDQPCKAGDETVNPFDVEDVFIFIQSHVEIDLDEFGGLLVFGEFLLPGLCADRRYGSADGIPFDDG